MKGLFRKANPQCDRTDCEMGNFHKSEATWGTIICTNCRIRGKNFGVPMVMPEDFKMPSTE